MVYKLNQLSSCFGLSFDFRPQWVVVLFPNNSTDDWLWTGSLQFLETKCFFSKLLGNHVHEALLGNAMGYENYYENIRIMKRVMQSDL